MCMAASCVGGSSLEKFWFIFRYCGQFTWLTDDLCWEGWQRDCTRLSVQATHTHQSLICKVHCNSLHGISSKQYGLVLLGCSRAAFTSTQPGQNSPIQCPLYNLKSLPRKSCSGFHSWCSPCVKEGGFLSVDPITLSMRTIMKLIFSFLLSQLANFFCDMTKRRKVK